MTGHIQPRCPCQPLFSSHDCITPGTGLNRVESDLAASIIMSLYSGFPVKRYAFPKLQYIMNPISWCHFRYCIESRASVYFIPYSFHFSSLVSSYIYHIVPGKNPLVQSSLEMYWTFPFIIVRGFRIFPDFSKIISIGY